MIKIAISEVCLASPEEAKTPEAGIMRGGIVTIDSPPGSRIGVAKGLFQVPDDIDAYNAEVGRMFLGENQGDSAL